MRILCLLAVLAGCEDDSAVCGDGRLSAGEACDDGNRTGGDSCPADCLPLASDIDGDGFVPPDDCNDRLASVHPGAPETPCDGLDNDCSDRTPDCDDPPPDAAAGRDAGDAGGSPEPDACQPRFDVCADCIDQDCDGADSPCDTAARIEFLPAAPAPGADFTVEASSPTAYAWVLLVVDTPIGDVQILDCPACVREGAGRYTWSFEVADAAPGLYTVAFTRDNVDDDPEEGSPVLCAAIEVRP